MSEHAIIFSERSFKNTAIVLREFTAVNQDGSSRGSSLLRGIISSNKITYRGSKDGEAVDIEKEGPTALIFTTTRAEEGLLFDGAEDARPLVGRCTQVPLTMQGLAKPAARWLQSIAQAEGLDGKPEAAYVRLFNDSAGSFREALQRIDAGAMLADTIGGKPA